VARETTTRSGGGRVPLPDRLLEELRRHSKAIDLAAQAPEPDWERLGGHLRALCRVMARAAVGGTGEDVVSSGS